MTVIAHDAKQLSPVAFIARTIISLGLSGRLPTTSWFQEVLDIGSGTVQKALQELKKDGAVNLVSRGHQGTFVVSWDFPTLWDAARMPPVHILLPLEAPSKRRRWPPRLYSSPNAGVWSPPSAICAARVRAWPLLSIMRWILFCSRPALHKC